MKIIKKVFTFIKEYFNPIAYFGVAFVVFLPEEQNQMCSTQNFVMLFCNMLAAFFTIDSIIKKKLQLILLERDSVNEKGVLAIASGEWKHKGQGNKFEEKYNKWDKARFPIWLFANILIIVFSIIYSLKYYKTLEQALNVYTYMNLVILLIDFEMNRKKTKRIKELLNQKKR